VPRCPGADDNASAVAALLELARWVGPYLDKLARFAARLQLAAYDLEESGFIGSLSHCRQLLRGLTPVSGMMSLEMLGYTDARPGSQQLPPELAGKYPDVGNFIGVCGNEDSRELIELTTASLKSIEGLPVESLAVPDRGEALPPTRLSDHSSFWDHGYPALMITDTSFMRNPHYHQQSDTADTLDYAFLAKVTAGVCVAVRRLLEG
jgi:Zn-dependent M28 family amino/carboxypeptidase